MLSSIARLFRHEIRRTPKHEAELAYWSGRFSNENGKLKNAHYQKLYTDVYGLSADFFSNKRILDIGCGPRGSLEWASMARERVGLDPLVPDYRKLGINTHKMKYCAANSENIPYADGYFDIVTSLNSLDHVDDIRATISDIKRVTRNGGTLLLSVEIDHTPTDTEPVTVDDAVLAILAPEFVTVSEYRVGTPIDHDLHGAVLRKSPPYVPGKPGIYVAQFRRA